MLKRIAIVEDNAAIRKNYTDALTRSGYDVDAYESRPVAMAARAVKIIAGIGAFPGEVDTGSPSGNATNVKTLRSRFT